MDKFWDDGILSSILNNQSSQIKILAALAGIPLEDLFKHGDFAGIDLRNQDLSGIDISNIDLRKCKIDESTKFDFENIKNKTFQDILRILENCENNGLYIDLIRKDIVDHLSFSGQVVIFKGKEESLKTALDNILQENEITTFTISKGYVRKKILLLDISRKYSLRDYILDILPRHFHGAFQVKQGWHPSMAQLELPLPDADSRRPLGSRIGMREIISVLRKREGINNIWVSYLEQYKNFSSNIEVEIKTLVKQGYPIKYILHDINGSLTDSSWIKSIFKKESIKVLDESDYYLNSIRVFLAFFEKSLNGKVKISKDFKQKLLSSSFEEAQRLLRYAAFKSAQNNKLLPGATIGLRNMA